MSEMHPSFKLTSIRRACRVPKGCQNHPTRCKAPMPILNARRRSPRSFQTRIWSSEYCTQNQDSSEKTTLGHSCTYIGHLVHQSRHFFLRIVEGSRSNGCLAANIVTPYEWT
ncbi:hypothetical protein TNCV_4878801 [Trichonephila clavipes]|nr:hypothetical protein TNCV_4878801 [Trichonephila clavipes]